MIAILVIVAVLNGQPVLRSQIVPPAVCDMLAHVWAERLAEVRGVSSIHTRCINVPAQQPAGRDA
jgi:hypothetical protein